MKAGIIRFARVALRFKRAVFNDGLAWSSKVGSQPSPQDGPRVLIATSVSGHLSSLNMEAVLGAALRERGARVEALLCDQALPACMDCEHRFFPTASARRALVRRGPKELCVSCAPVGARVYSALGIPVRGYSHYLSDLQRVEARRTAESVAFDDIRGFELDGIAVGEHAYAGALRFFARGDIGQEPYAEQIVRRYLEASILTVHAVRRLLSERRYDVCVFNHGIYVPQGLIGEVCRRNGVRVVNWNPAYRKNCFIFSHGDTYHHTLMNEPVQNWESLAWNEEIERTLMTYLKSRWVGSDDWIWFHERPVFDVSAIQERFGIDFSKPIIGLLTNVVWDAQLHYPANAFPGMVEWIVETVRYFEQHKDLQLVIRVHPAEIRGTLPSRQNVVDEIAKVFPRLPDNVFVIPPESDASTYAVMSQCDSVVIYGTKTGVELTSMGIPVIVAGEAWIRNKGITQDATSVAQYRSILDRLPFGEAMSKEQTQRARKYAYHFFFRRMIPLPFMKPRKGWPAFAPDVATSGDLAPGRWPGLDVICDGILTGSEFVFPAERGMP